MRTPVVRTLVLSTILFPLFAPPNAPATDLGAAVMPRLTLGGRLISTLDATWAQGEGRDDDDSYNVNVADTSLLLRADRKLFDQSIGGAVVGLEFPDPDADFTDTVFYHQVFAFLWDRNYQVELGRTKLRNTLVEFPTLRDDDLLRFTEIQNGFSHSNTEEYQQFGNHLAVDLFFPGQRLVATGYLAQRIETDPIGQVLEEFDLNSGGLQIQYRQPDPLRFAGRLRQLGLAWDTQQVDVAGDEWKQAVMAGGVVNLTMDPQDHWEGLAQAIYDGGAGDTDLTTLQGRALAESLSVVAGVNFRRSTFQLLRWKASLTGAYKNYLDAGDAWEWSAIPSLQYQLGDGVGLLAQYQYTNRGDALAEIVGFDQEHTVQLGLSFDFETMFNDYIGERQSILNLEHGYVR